MRSLSIISPINKFKLIFDIFFAVQILIYMYLATIKLSYYILNMKESLHLNSLAYIITLTLTYLIDIILNFNTGRYISNK